MKMMKGASPRASQGVAHSVQVILRSLHTNHIDQEMAAFLAFVGRNRHSVCRAVCHSHAGVEGCDALAHPVPNHEDLDSVWVGRIELP